MSLLIEIKELRQALARCLRGAETMGKDVTGLQAELEALPDSYDALAAFGDKIAALPERSDWGYEEPDDWQGIKAAWGEGTEEGGERPVDASERIEAAFLARVCGCMLGKPVEVDPTYAVLKEAGEKSGQWPLSDYISQKMLDAMGRGWPEATREQMRFAVPDDDINYTITGMLLLEEHGPGFTREDHRRLWMTNLAPYLTWGPERTFLAKSTLRGSDEEYDGASAPDYDRWLNVLNHGAELCGALIRVDAYGYAAAGKPALAAQLAWKDSSLTHVRTGVYSSMYIAAAIAIAAVERDPMVVMTRALDYVPQKSRFAEVVRECLAIVGAAGDWLEGYEGLRQKYGEQTHCQINFEVGTLINSLKFAENSGDAFCKQVMQGNDTDSFGATAGSIAGMIFGPDGLDEKWLKPLNGQIRTSLALFHDTDLMALAKRLGRLAL